MTNVNTVALLFFVFSIYHICLHVDLTNLSMRYKRKAVISYEENADHMVMNVHLDRLHGRRTNKESHPVTVALQRNPYCSCTKDHVAR